MPLGAAPGAAAWTSLVRGSARRRDRAPFARTGSPRVTTPTAQKGRIIGASGATTMTTVSRGLSHARSFVGLRARGPLAPLPAAAADALNGASPSQPPADAPKLYPNLDLDFVPATPAPAEWARGRRGRRARRPPPRRARRQTPLAKTRGRRRAVARRRRAHRRDRRARVSPPSVRHARGEGAGEAHLGARRVGCRLALRADGRGRGRARALQAPSPAISDGSPARRRRVLPRVRGERVVVGARRVGAPREGSRRRGEFILIFVWGRMGN